ncbi:hypothetical protein Trco_008120 [Trichoderma cornu-damae]|uniref:Uncharacterized protein n=1 Tax=Trichoderma cornu-damae TaxID=654480 RepID=A0A9P8QI76_9HYPO|nr:hypothetical protein Trco_008120 [Trichoderma cornu-damae]
MPSPYSSNLLLRYRFRHELEAPKLEKSSFRPGYPSDDYVGFLDVFSSACKWVGSKKIRGMSGAMAWRPCVSPTRESFPR